MSKINKIRLDGTDYDIERGMLPEVAQELPQTGSEDTMYLVPSENPGTQIETVSGESLTVQNDLPYEAPLASVEMLGNATQNGTPTPDSPVPISVVTGENVVKVCGKNLLNKSVGFTNKWINTNGVEVAGNTNALFNGYIEVAPNTTYTLSFKSSVYNMVMSEWNESKTFVKQNIKNASTSYTITTQATTKFLRVNFNYNGSTTVTQDIIDSLDIQLELGSTATAYEPYQGQEFEVNLGKNLFDKSTATQNYRLGSTGDPFADSAYYLSDYISVIQSTAYYISGTSGNIESSAVCFYASDKSFISRRAFVNDWYTFTTPANTAFLRFTTLKTNSIDQVQLEKGSQATSFAPYFTPIELAKIGNYQDRIYKDSGKWYVEKQVGKVVLDGSADEFWYAQYYGGYTYYCAIALTAGIAELPSENILMCDNFTTTTWDNRAQNLPNSLYTNLATAGSPKLEFRNTSQASVSDWTTWLSTHPTTVYYALATPTTTEITNEALIAQLDALGASSLYVGVNNIGTETLNAVPTLVLGYDAIDPQKKYDEYIWVEDDQEFELIGQAGAIQQLQRDVAEVKGGSSVTHLIPVIEDGAVWDEWQLTKDRSYAPWRLLSCDNASFNVSGTSETMSLQDVFTALENGAEYVFDSLPLDEVDPVILGLNPPEYPEVSGVTVASRQSFSYVSGPDPATDTINVVFHSGSVESIFVPYNENPRVYKVMTGVLRQEEAGGEYKYLFMLGRVISMTPIN